jgi:hypothetical protein
MRWELQVAHIGQINAYRILVRRPEEKRSVGRPRFRCEDIIKKNIIEKLFEAADWFLMSRIRTTGGFW